LHRFVDAAADTLQSKELGDVTWLEHGLRETSQGMCRDVLRWLLALQGYGFLAMLPARENVGSAIRSGPRIPSLATSL
jgi:hypothetical protein